MKKEMYEVHKIHQQDNWWFKARREIVHSIIDKYIVDSNNNILEVGAGYGIMTSMLKEYGTVTAIEPYPDSALALRNAFNIKTFCCTLDEFDEYKGNRQYDIVAMFDVLEHIEDNSGDTLFKVGRLLKNKGLFIFTVPAYNFLWSKHDELNNHYRRYTRGKIVQRLGWFGWHEKTDTKDYKFTIKKATYFNTLLFPLALLDKLWFAKNKQSYSLNPNRVVNSILYSIFKIERYILKYFNLPYGVSILLVAEKRS